jgi:hypothetical protein
MFLLLLSTHPADWMLWFEQVVEWWWYLIEVRDLTGYLHLV